MSKYAQGFNGIELKTIDGSDFVSSYETVKSVFETVRSERRPFIIHAHVPLLGHHTSGVRMEWYRDDLAEAQLKDPYPKLLSLLKQAGWTDKMIQVKEGDIKEQVDTAYDKALNAEDPDKKSLTDFIFAPSPITEERGERSPKGKKKTVMVDAASFCGS